MGITFISITVKVILTTFCIMLFFHVHDMEKGGKKLWRAIMGSLICCLGLLVATVLPRGNDIKVVIMLLCITIAMFLWKRFRFVRTFYLSLFFCFLYLSAYILVNLIGEWCAWSPAENPFYLILTEFLSAGVLIIMILGVKRIQISFGKGFSLKRQWFSFFMIVANAILLLLEGVEIMYAGKKAGPLFLIIHLLCICGCGYLLVTDYGKKQAEYLAFMVKMKSFGKVEGEEDLEKLIASQRKRAHEYRNHIYCIYYLAQREGCREIMEFIEDLDSGMYETAPAISSTGNVIVDVILNAKYRDALAKGIAISVRTEPLNDVFMKKEDLVVLFSNLLNNAMEAAGMCKEAKVIYVEVKMLEGRVCIIIGNTHSNIITGACGVLYTTKTADPAEHGYGLNNIKEIVKRYNGECHITYTESEFRVRVLI